MLRYSSMKWMCNNLLKLNQDKTELVVKILNVRVGDEFIAPKSSACNPGVIVDNCFFMKKHVKKICNEANYHVRNISKKQTNISSTTFTTTASKMSDSMHN